jgi:hypothetical protein
VVDDAEGGGGIAPDELAVVVVLAVVVAEDAGCVFAVPWVDAAAVPDWRVAAPAPV